MGKTLAHILGLKVTDHGILVGRVLSEAIPGGATPQYRATTLRSDPGAGGLRTMLEYQIVGKTRYFDAAGFSGRTIGLTGTIATNVSPAAR